MTFNAMQIASTINFPAERIRCLANVEKGYRCTNKGTVNVKKFYSTKSTTDKIMDCLCGIHKYHLERTVRCSDAMPHATYADSLSVAGDHLRTLSAVAERKPSATFEDRR